MTYFQHIRAILVLGLPLIGSHVAQFAITLIDAVMLGWYDVQALAAQVLGSMVFFVVFIVGSGFAWAVMPMVAEAEAAGNHTQVRRYTRMAIWISMLFGAIVMPLMIWSEPLLRALGQTPEISATARDYLIIAGWGLFPALVVMVLKSYLAALELTRVVLWVTLGAVVVNAVANYGLIFGNWGLPEMGIRGAAVASLMVHGVSMVLLAIYAAVKTAEHEIFVRFWRPDWEAFGQMFRLGWPIGLTSLAEVGLFAGASAMMGWLGEIPLAAHGIALQIISITFMVHLGLSNAATVRAGRAVGRKDAEGLRRGGQVVIAMSLVMALLSVLVLLAIPEVLLGAFLSPDDPQRANVIALGIPLLMVAAVFQLFDGAQVVALGLLRGVQDARVPMVIAGVAYWLIGLPVSYGLGFVLGWHGPGVWIGLTVGLIIAAALLMGRFWGYSVRRIV